MSEKIIYVYENWTKAEPNMIGKLYVSSEKGKEHYSFEYDEKWLTESYFSSILDPELSFYKGRQYPISKNTFGLFSDSAPDRWGRMLIDRRERFLAQEEGRKPRKLYESDYLIGVYDETRMGAIRFKLDKDGDFLSNDRETAAPPWTSLRTLEEASREFENEDNIMIKKWLNQLIRPGSSLGGARPKAGVIDANGSLWIAKFPSRNDDIDVGAWEKVVHDLARLCFLDVPESKLEKFSNLGSTFLVKRFDRIGSRRIHFASAMTMLNRVDGASSDDGVSYLDILSFIKSNGSSPKKDAAELWKRIVFNMAVSNTDDHLRNHGFILSASGWRLSPLYDVNPVPYGDCLSLNVDENDSTISLELVLDTAEYYGLKRNEAERIAFDILNTVKNKWEKIAVKYGINRAAIEYMRPAFELKK